MNSFLSLLTTLLPPLFLALSANGAPAGPASSSWVVEGASKMRLLAAGLGSDGKLRAGLEIQLDPGWKTYWINPGPTGLPPRLDFSGSSNLASSEALWPAPVRFSDGGTDSVGYSGHIIVPLRIEPKEAGQPVLLKAAMDYGICEKICLPARVELELELEPGTRADAFELAQLAGFEGRVPQPAELGADAPLAVSKVEANGDALVVSVRFPPDARSADLFASADGGTVGVPKPLDAPGAYRIKIKSGPVPRAVHLVAVADGKAIRVPVALDDLPSRP